MIAQRDTGKIGQQRLATWAVAIYKDYDGNAPATADLIVVKTEAVATEVIILLERAAGNAAGDNSVEYCGRTFELNLPVCEDFEWCGRYETSLALAEDHRIATSVAEALSQLA